MHFWIEKDGEIQLNNSVIFRKRDKSFSLPHFRECQKRSDTGTDNAEGTVRIRCLKNLLTLQFKFKFGAIPPHFRFSILPYRAFAFAPLSNKLRPIRWRMALCRCCWGWWCRSFCAFLFV